MKFVFDYRYSDGEWTLSASAIIESSGLETACFEFEKMYPYAFHDYDVYELGRQLR